MIVSIMIGQWASMGALLLHENEYKSIYYRIAAIPRVRPKVISLEDPQLSFVSEISMDSAHESISIAVGDNSVRHT